MFARWLHGGVRLCACGGIGRGQREYAHRGVHPRHQGMYQHFGHSKDDIYNRRWFSRLKFPTSRMSSSIMTTSGSMSSFAALRWADRMLDSKAGRSRLFWRHRANANMLIVGMEMEWGSAELKDFGAVARTRSQKYGTCPALRDYSSRFTLLTQL